LGWSGRGRWGRNRGWRHCGVRCDLPIGAAEVLKNAMVRLASYLRHWDLDRAIPSRGHRPIQLRRNREDFGDREIVDRGRCSRILEVKSSVLASSDQRFYRSTGLIVTNLFHHFRLSVLVEAGSRWRPNFIRHCIISHRSSRMEAWSKSSAACEPSDAAVPTRDGAGEGRRVRGRSGVKDVPGLAVVPRVSRVSDRREVRLIDGRVRLRRGSGHSAAGLGLATQMGPFE